MPLVELFDCVPKPHYHLHAGVNVEGEEFEKTIAIEDIQEAYARAKKLRQNNLLKGISRITVYKRQEGHGESYIDHQPVEEEFTVEQLGEMAKNGEIFPIRRYKIPYTSEEVSFIVTAHKTLQEMGVEKGDLEATILSEKDFAPD